MRTIVLADARQKEALMEGLDPSTEVVWVDDVDSLANSNGDAFIDLRFVNDEGRKELLRRLLPKPVIINSVTDTLEDTDPAFIRINGWETFLASPVLEAVCNNKGLRQKAANVFALFGKQVEWLPDALGFVNARVVSMIVNEAYLTLEEGVTTREEIDTAMKLGTAYPYGPFEWAEKIGQQNIVALLRKLSETQPRYRVAGGLVDRLIS